MSTDVPEEPPAPAPPKAPRIGHGNTVAWVAAVGTLLAGIGTAIGVFMAPSGGPVDKPEPTVTAPADAPVRSWTELALRFQVLAQQSDLRGDGTLDVPGQLANLRTDDNSVDISLPKAWSDAESFPWLDDEGVTIGFAVAAAPDVDLLYETPDTPGVFIGISPEHVAPAEYLDNRRTGRETDCVFHDDQPFEGEGWSGRYVLWKDCGPTNAVLVDTIVNHRSSNGSLALFLRLNSREDIESIGPVLSSMQIDITKYNDDGGHKTPGLVTP